MDIWRLVSLYLVSMIKSIKSELESGDTPTRCVWLCEDPHSSVVGAVYVHVLRTLDLWFIFKSYTIVKYTEKSKDSHSITLWRKLASWGNALKLYKGDNTKLWGNKGGWHQTEEKRGGEGSLLSNTYNQRSAPNSLGKISRLTKIYNLAAESGRGENSLREKWSRASHSTVLISGRLSRSAIFRSLWGGFSKRIIIINQPHEGIIRRPISM